MEQNKTILAIIISVGIIMAWTWLFPTPPPEERVNEVVRTDEPSFQSPTQNLTSSSASRIVAADSAPLVLSSNELSDNIEAKDILIETDNYRAVIDTRGGVLKSLLMKKHHHFKDRISLGKWIPFFNDFLGSVTPSNQTEDNLVQMIKSDFTNQVKTLGLEFSNRAELTELFQRVVYTSDQDAIVIMSEDSSQSLVLTSPVRSGVQIIKTFTFHSEDYSIDYRVNLINRSDSDTSMNVRHIFGEGGVYEKGSNQVRTHIGPVYLFGEDLETVDTEDLISSPSRIAQMEWLGIENSYFIAAVTDLGKVSQGFFEARSKIDRAGEREWLPIFGMSLPPLILQPQKQVESNFKLYYGPKDEAEMRKFGSNLQLSIDIWLKALAVPLLDFLRFINSYIGNFGVSIIILTIIVRLVLFPLTYKGSKSMKRMQLLAPKMKKLKEKYKDNKEKLNQEMMGLYKKHKVNPVGGCFPMLLQLPVFFALYNALSAAVELRHEPFFLWISDLSAPDGLLITPILMGISMYLVQKMTPTSAMMDPMQAKIMGMLPLIFTFFTFTFPTGLTLYWVTSNILSIGQTYLISKIEVPDLEG